ncbi:hypothetical protein J6590_005291 [Homalodisca vitripennis]|nr:hypothetical protein J6590_005290 [Homalodisca vitripennis]KAG8254730.1 hypothetical protein J6590_005291 [Homalodisca vitripennis]
MAWHLNMIPTEGCVTALTERQVNTEECQLVLWGGVWRDEGEGERYAVIGKQQPPFLFYWILSHNNV